MEKSVHETGIPSSRQSDLKKSFKTAVRSILTGCSRQDFLEIFSKFSGVEQNTLYRLFTQVIVNLHQSLEDEFDAQCQDFEVLLTEIISGRLSELLREIVVEPILDKIEQLVEEQSLDPLFSDKTNVMDIANDITTAKKNEIQKLKGLLQMAEEQNRQMEARISLLRKQPQEVSGTANAIEKLKSGISGYFQGNYELPPK